MYKGLGEAGDGDLLRTMKQIKREKMAHNGDRRRV